MFKFNKKAKLSTATLATLLLVTAAHAVDFQVLIPQQPTNTESLILWAEQTYPQLFPGHPKTITVPATPATATQAAIPSVAYRYYPQTGNYLGVSPADVTTVLPAKIWTVVNGKTGEKDTGTTTGPQTLVSPAPGATVYVMGAGTQNQAVAVGVPEDYKCAVYPGRCVPNTYPVGSVHRWYFEEINDLRIHMGLMPFLQDTRLDAAATSHALYLTHNGQFGHNETAGLPYYTGATPTERATAAGIANLPHGAAEVVASGDRMQLNAAKGLLNTVYHREVLLSPCETHIGIGMDDYTENLKATGNPTVMNTFSMNGICNTVPNGWMGTYPLDGQKNVPTAMSEWPNPAPEFAVIGSPVSVHFTDADVVETVLEKFATGYTFLRTSAVKVQTFTLTAPDGSVAPGKVLDLARSWYFVPNGELAWNTTYTVHFVGSSPTRNIDKTWTFTTRNDGQYY